MTDQEETEREKERLWQRHRRGDREARARLIEWHDYLVPLTVQKAVPAVPVSIEFADLCQEGRIALCRAVDKFDPGRGVRFRSYAISLIRNACLEYLRQEDWVPRSVRDAVKRDSEQADRVIVLISLDEFLRVRNQEERAEDFRRWEVLKDPGPGPEEITLSVQQARLIRALVRFLPQKERQVLQGFYWQEQTGQALTKSGRVSESAIHVRHRQALEHLRRLAEQAGVPADG